MLLNVRASQIPLRRASRVLLLDPDRRVLLMKFVFGSGQLKSIPYWTTPGGRAEDDESFESAAKRELREETGLDLSVGPVVAIRQAPQLHSEKGVVLADERYFIVSTSKTPLLSNAEWTAREKESVKESRWWTLDEIRNSHENIWPTVIGDILRASPDKWPLVFKSSQETLATTTINVDYTS